MSFHPAVYGALYVALREHETSRASALSVADMYDTSEQVAYCDAAIAHLRKALDLLHASDRDVAEQQAERDAEMQATAWSAADQFEHDQACEAAIDAADAERWAAEDGVAL